MEIKWFLAVRMARSAGRVRWFCGGAKGRETERKKAVRSAEVSLSIMRKVRGCARDLKKVTTDEKAET